MPVTTPFPGEMPESALDRVAADAPEDWHAVEAEGALHVSLPAVGTVGADSRADLLWEIARSLPPAAVALRVSIAVARGTAFDAAGIVAPLGGDAPALAAALASMPHEAGEPGAEAIWDRLALGARRLRGLQDQKQIAAGVLTLRGRGRIVGGLRGDLLIRFGVSAWR